MKEIKGIIFDIKKFAIHDGPGIRTTIFLKGCPLHCIWCHNPESIKPCKEISFLPEKCIRCGFCVAMCPHKNHILTEKMHIYKREECEQCGICTTECYTKALEVIGKEVTVEEVMEDVLKDVPFYETSGGGMTISGGEPMFQFEFTKELLKNAKKYKLHTCLDTSGFASWDKFKEILNYVDIFLYDFKESNSNNHQKFTGVKPDIIWNNLFRLDEHGAKIILRCPIIPGLNDRKEHFRKIAEYAEKLCNLIEINIEPYHPLGKSKLQRLGITDYQLAELSFPEQEIITQWLKYIQSHTSKPVKKG